MVLSGGLAGRVSTLGCAGCQPVRRLASRRWCALQRRLRLTRVVGILVVIAVLLAGCRGDQNVLPNATSVFVLSRSNDTHIIRAVPRDSDDDAHGVFALLPGASGGTFLDFDSWSGWIQILAADCELLDELAAPPGWNSYLIVGPGGNGEFVTSADVLTGPTDAALPSTTQCQS
jgi:hypothetical protein